MRRIVLVRPQGPRNVGSVVRLIANFPAAELVLVRPERPALLQHPDFTQMAHGAEEVAEKVRVVEHLSEALADCTIGYGFTARSRDHRAVRDWREAADEIVAHAHAEDRLAALVFGCEEHGLTTQETEPLQELVRMPTSSGHGSINVAMTVGIVLSTIFFRDAPSARAAGSMPITGADRAFLTAHLKDALGALTTSEPARRDLEASVERVFSRAPLETRDARAWHLLARAVGSRKTPADYGLGGAEDGGA